MYETAHPSFLIKPKPVNRPIIQLDSNIRVAQQAKGYSHDTRSTTHILAEFTAFLTLAQYAAGQTCDDSASVGILSRHLVTTL
jgi:hypothetical protein